MLTIIPGCVTGVKNIKEDGQMPFRGVEFSEQWVSSLSSIMRGNSGIEWQLK